MSCLSHSEERKIKGLENLLRIQETSTIQFLMLPGLFFSALVSCSPQLYKIDINTGETKVCHPTGHHAQKKSTISTSILQRQFCISVT